MTIDPRIAAAEAAYLDARNARDRLDVARATGAPAKAHGLESAADRAILAARASLAAFEEDEASLGEEDRRALRTMRAGLDSAETLLLPGVTAHAAGEAAAADAQAPAAPEAAAAGAGGEHGYAALHNELEAAYGQAAGSLWFEGRAMTRPQVLAALAGEPDPARRRALFLALEPLWRAVDGNGDEASPYRSLIGASVMRWQSGRSPMEANARALGIPVGEVEAWVLTVLAGWRDAFVEPARGRGEPPVEPWDWWWRAGEIHRLLRPSLPPGVLLDVTRAVYASLGADTEALGIVFDVHDRPGRPGVPVAFTTFDGRPHRRADGTWDPGRPTILEALTDGGLGELAELIHETGHAIHIAGIRTRPAFADWPDSDAVTEALAELVALDVYEPAWQRRWLPGAPPVADTVAVRGRHAETALDAAWALFEIRLHATPERRPNDVWTEIATTWLGIEPHPEWSWWAIRGQLVEEPGYMANYAIGAVLAEDLRAAIRDARGPWIHGDPGWYDWVRERVYRFGLERASRDVLADVLGRAPNAEALQRQLARAAPG